MKTTLAAALVFLALAGTAAQACSDPEQHKKHLQQMMEQGVREGRSGDAQGQPQAAAQPKSNLDSESSFFGAVGRSQGAPEEGRRDRTR